MFVMIDAVQLQTQPIEISGLQASGFWPPARPTRCRVLTGVKNTRYLGNSGCLSSPRRLDPRQSLVIEQP